MDINIVLILILLFIETILSERRLKKSKRAKSSSSSSSSSISLSSGLTLHFHGKSSSILHQWATEIDRYGGVTHSQATSREQQVISLMNQGLADIQTYHQYQRLAAGTGNVDSGRLLMDYGIGISLSELSSLSDTISRQVFDATVSCNINTINNLIHNENISVDHALDDGMTLLIAASYSGCLGVVEFLINEGSDVEAFGSNGVNALMAAAGKGHEQVIEALVVKGKASINSKHKFADTTALHIAGELGKVSAIKKLCDLGGDIYSRTTVGSTVLHTAAHVGVEDQINSNGTIDAIINYCKFDPNILMNNDTTSLYLAAQFGWVNTTIALLRAGSNVNFYMPIEKYNGDKFVTASRIENYNSLIINSEQSNGASAIHAASEEGHSEVVQILIDFGADINSKTIGVTPLHLAVQYNRSDVVRTLLKNGADVNEVSLLDESTSLYCASGKGLITIMELLLDAGANPHIQQISTGFPLLYSALSGQYEAVKILLKYNVDVNMSTNTGLTSLLAASNQGDIAIMKLLLKAKANPLATTNDGFNILHLLTLSNSKFKTEIMRKLFDFLTHTINTNVVDLLINARDKEGNGIIHYAVSKQDQKLTQFLISREVDVNAKNKMGEFSLFLASMSGNVNIVTSLIKAGCDCNAVTSNGVTPLLAAIDRDHIKVVMALLTRHSSVSIDQSFDENITTNVADVNKGTTNGIMQSPLLYAVVKSKSEIAKILLDSGSYCNIIIATNPNNLNGETLLDYAKRKRDYDMIQVLTNYTQCDPDNIRK